MEGLLNAYRLTSSVVAAAALVVVNLVPLVGVLLWGWDLWLILALYWLENGIVGAFNVLKMLRAEGTASPMSSMIRVNGRPVEMVARGPLTGFFVLHYGLFWLAHGFFVLLVLPLLVGLGAGGPLFSIGPDAQPAFLPFDIPQPRWDLVAFGGLGLAASHGASFVLNYLGRGEYRVTSPARLLFAPYGRLLVLHLAIVLGGVASGWAGAPLGALVVLVVLKTALDLFFHLREHRRVELPVAGLPA